MPYERSFLTVGIVTSEFKLGTSLTSSGVTVSVHVTIVTGTVRTV